MSPRAGNSYSQTIQSAAVSVVTGGPSALTFVGWRRSRAQNGRSMWWQAMSAMMPPPKAQ